MNIQADILSALSYFDMFRYPLTQTEIFQFLKRPYNSDDLTAALHLLQCEGRIHKLDEFYLLRPDYSLVVRRRKGNIRAKQMLNSAGRVSSFLSHFPFVRGVAVSGSLSKNFADEHSDIDFFIIAKRNRLWIARTLMHIAKKVSFLFNKQHFFCMNYFVDEEMLEISEKNIYTSIEIATLLPLQGIKAFQEFYLANTWSRQFLPNHGMRISYVKEMKRTWLKIIAEAVLNYPLGGMLDRALLKFTSIRWKQKTTKRQLNKRGEVMSMVCSRHCAKPNPKIFQNQLLKLYQEKMQQMADAYQSLQTSV